MPPRNAQALLEQALALPDARREDFVRTPLPADVLPNLLKVIADTTLRARMIGAGLVLGIQSPKGPQKIPSIIRLYPAFDAPAAPKTTSAGKRTGKPAGRPSQALPSVEDMEALLTRIRAIEGHVARELSMSIDAEIGQAQRRVAEAAADGMEAAFGALGELLEKRRDARRHVRAAAFARIEADKEFGLRGFLRLVAREVGPGAEELANPR